MHLSKATVLVFDRCMFPLMHIKIYLIHNEIYFGSANFTDAAMFKNGLEALMRIDDEQQKLVIYTFVVFMIGKYFPDLIKSLLTATTTTTTTTSLKRPHSSIESV